MYKQDLEKAEESEIKLTTSLGSYKKAGNSRKTFTSASLTMLKPLTVWITKKKNPVENASRNGNSRPPYLPPGKLVYRSRRAVRTGHGTTDWFQIGKGCVLSSCLFNLYAEYIMRNAGMDEAQAGIKTVMEISITSDRQMTPPLWQKVKRN